MVENTVGKGEFAHYEQFLHFPTEFLKDLYGRHIKTRACLGRVNLVQTKICCFVTSEE